MEGRCGPWSPGHRHLVAAEASVSHRSPAVYGERLDVWVRTAALGCSSSVFEYRIVEQTTGRLVATGRTVQVIYDYAAGRSTPVPPELRARFEAFEGRPLSRTE